VRIGEIEKKWKDLTLSNTEKMKANNFWEVKTYLTFKLRHDGLTPHMTCQPLDNKNNFLVRSADYVKEIIFLVGLKSV